ncbi:hypothetical protein B0H14DRAFT_3428249 [Mycena olivaceomarginata]|jgi:hypothetical protein|nr:hypothetical protein B0H14DRAFT_3428249 [Mycena olivaceomarginata]
MPGPETTTTQDGTVLTVPFELTLFPRFNLLHGPSHEARVFHLCRRIVETVDRFAESAVVPVERDELREMAEAISSASLCVAYVSHLSSTDQETAYEALREGRVQWSETDSERLWDLYRRATRSGEKLDVERLQVAIPDLAAPPPVIRACVADDE